MTDAEEPTPRQPAGDEHVPHPQGPAVVGIGASAGGLRALKELFATVPADSGLAFVVVVHLAADQESHLAELLQPHSPIPVEQVTGMTAIKANRVYVIPPGRNLSAVDSHLRLAPLEEQRVDRAPVDHFLRTLSETHDGCSVAVILSGSGSDGKQGVRHVRGRGGLVVVQDPAEAEFDSMPRSAIDTGVADLVLPVPAMLAHVLEFARTSPRVPENDPAPGERDDGLLQKVLTLVRLRTGHDFLRYKRSTVARRVARRMQILNLESLPEYVEVLRESPDAAAALLDDLLINVTRFFRDPEVFESLQETVIPRLFEGKGAGDRVRVWSVGCATGEEAYTLGMLLLEAADRQENAPEVQVFATDLHEGSLRIAREALYPESIAQEVSPERLKRFFREEEGGYRVGKRLRDTVVFAVHNFLGDPPFSKLDLIVCRNVLIYLQRGVQAEVVDTFHYALRGGGFLLVGSAETLDHPDLFRVADKEHHLYQRRELDRGRFRLPGLSLPPAPVPRSTEPSQPRVEAGGFGALHQAMVERYAPPSLLVSAAHEVVHLSESVGVFLRHPGGTLTSNVFLLVREEFRTELRTALHLAREEGQIRRSAPVALRIEGEMRHVVLRVSPAWEESLRGMLLVIFDEVAPAEPVPASAAGVPDGVVRELEVELEATRYRLRSILEEFESSEEEMRAANEELQSANEELRSTMEELETSREELQSTNEELHTLNQENRHRVEELSQLTGDLHNLLQATDVATIFLDRNLRILRYTPRVGELFNVRLSDRGRPLADLTHRLGYDGLIEDARRVLHTLVPFEHELQDESGGGLLLRVMPYRTLDDRIEGVVITLIDVSALKAAEAAVRRSEERQRLLLRLSDALRPLDDPAEIQQQAMRTLGEHLNADRVFYAVVHTDGAACTVERDFHAADVASVVGEISLARLGGTLLADLRAGRTISVRDVSADPRLAAEDRAGYLSADVAAAMGVPLLRGERWVALLSVHQRVPRDWTPDELALAEDVADRTWAAVERARAEAALRETEARSRAIIEGALDYAILTIDPDGIIQSWSPGAQTVFGWTAEEAIGRDLSMTFTPEDRAAGEDRKERATARREGSALDVRWHQRKDGNRVFVEGMMRTLGDGGAVRGFLKVGQNLTQRRQVEEALRGSEARFQTLVQNIRDYAIFMLDSRGFITDWTEGAERVKGYSAGEVVGEHLAIFYTPEQIAAGQPQGELAQAEATGRSEREDWRVRKGGERFWANEIATAVRDEEGTLVGFTKISRDLTERKQAEEALLEWNETLEERVNERTAILAETNETLNREVEQRVQAEEGRRQVLRQLVTAEEEERRRISRELHDSMGQLVTGLMMGLRSLETAQAENDLRPGIPPLIALADRIAREMQHLAVELRPPILDNLGLAPALRNHLEDWSQRSAVPYDFHAVGLDGERMSAETEITVYRVVQEGLTNVLKHSGATHVSLVLERRRGTVSAILEDNGRGFDVEETLARPDKARRLGVRGMRERVALLGGTLQIESSPGGGTSLFVRLADRATADPEPER